MKTSQSDPLRIDSVGVGPGYGRIGLTFCPGKKQLDAQSGAWDRDLDEDMAAIEAFGASALVTLMPDSELNSLGVSPNRLRDKASELGLEWYQLPIPDGGIPKQKFEELWVDAGLRLLDLLKAGHNIVIHCKGGLGRTGTIAAMHLIEFKMSPRTASNPFVRHVQAQSRSACKNSTSCRKRGLDESCSILLR
jgi:ADP-ribosyl-[dinitrogen reductase] hydrolase